MFSSTLPDNPSVGSTWQATYHHTGPNMVPPGTGEMSIRAIEMRTVGGKQLRAARVGVSGSMRGRTIVKFAGEIVVDLDSGLLLEAKIQADFPSFTMNRRLMSVSH